MAKKEKLVDLKPEKISDEQLERMQKLVSGINKIQFDMGTEYSFATFPLHLRK